MALFGIFFDVLGLFAVFWELLMAFTEILWLLLIRPNNFMEIVVFLKHSSVMFTNLSSTFVV